MMVVTKSILIPKLPSACVPGRDGSCDSASLILDTFAHRDRLFSPALAVGSGPCTHIILPYSLSGGVRIDVVKVNESRPVSSSSRSPKTRVRLVEPHSSTSNQPLLVMSAPAARK